MVGAVKKGEIMEVWIVSVKHGFGLFVDSIIRPKAFLKLFYGLIKYLEQGDENNLSKKLAEHLHNTGSEELKTEEIVEHCIYKVTVEFEGFITK